MTTSADRPLRIDAARNADRILRAARDVYAELGPDAPIDVIAARAGVGERTLYRRFPSKAGLIRAALGQIIDGNISPAIEEAERNVKPTRRPHRTSRPPVHSQVRGSTRCRSSAASRRLRVGAAHTTTSAAASITATPPSA